MNAHSCLLLLLLLRSRLLLLLRLLLLPLSLDSSNFFPAASNVTFPFPQGPVLKSTLTIKSLESPPTMTKQSQNMDYIYFVILFGL
mmetsp:Transcript_28102/g.65965  ORF Transcript_28102/g.65965 Transcript_28102/m.65965 type:complete len:86 (-) Transcript_28102:330-587(-)